MPTTHAIEAFDTTLQTTHLWLNELCERMCWADAHRAYYAFRAVLHALRDRLTIDEVAALGAQLPMLIRGFYYEGWHPAGKPLKERKKEEFLAHVAAAYREESTGPSERITRNVFAVVAAHISPGEAESVRRVLPEEIRELWPSPHDVPVAPPLCQPIFKKAEF